MPLIIPTAAQLDSASGMISGYLSSMYMRLFVSNITITPSTTLSALLAAEASFTGYSPSALVAWTTPSTQLDGSAGTFSSNGRFTPTASGGTGPIYGYFLTDILHTKFYGAELLSAAPVSTPLGVTLEIDVTYTALSRF